jgi:hypothetical protein
VTYRIRWDSNAFRRLHSAWRQADEPQAALEAFDMVEAALCLDAHDQGESRTDDLRILIIPPLGVLFQARPKQQEVLVVDAWLIPSRKQ